MSERDRATESPDDAPAASSGPGASTQAVDARPDADSPTTGGTTDGTTEATTGETVGATAATGNSSRDRPLFVPACIAVGVMVAWRIVVGILAADEENISPAVGVTIGILLPMGFVTLYPLIVLRRSGQRIIRRVPGVSRLIVESAIALPVMLLTLTLSATIGWIWSWYADVPTGMPPEMQKIAASGNWPLLLLMVGLACLWAPWAEELFFRRFLFRALASRMPIVAAVVIESVMFALAHQYVGIHFVSILLLGLVLTGMYLWRRTLVAPVLVHMMQNTLASLAMVLLFVLQQMAPVLGIVGDEHPQGCLVQEVAPGSGAAEAGLEPGDVIVTLNQQPVQDFDQLRGLLMGRQAGERVNLTLMRNGRARKVKVRLMSRSEANALSPANESVRE